MTRRAAGPGLTVLLDPSSQLPVLPPRGQGSSWSARSRAAARTNELDAGKRRKILERRGRARLRLAYRVALVFPERGGRSGLASTHPPPRQRAGGCHDHVSGTRAAQSMIERGAGRRLMPRGRARPGLGGPPVVTAAAAARSRWRLASRRAGGTRGSAACGRSRWWRSSSPGVWRWPRGWRRSPGTAWRSAPPGSVPSAARPGPARGMRPCRTVRSEPRTVGVSPAQDASLRALPNRVMSPISASIINAVNWPTPGSVVRTLTRGSALACWCSSPSIRPVSGARPAGDRQAVSDDLPRRRRQDPARPANRDPGRSSSWRTGHSRSRRPPRGSGSAGWCPAGPARPGAAAARGAGGPPPGRSTRPAAGPHAAAAPGSRRRPLSFFSRAEAIALHRSGCTRCASKP